jgi:hypothetical protein
MKPLHVALLLAAGAGGGALFMMVAQRSHQAAPAVQVAQAPTQPAAQPPATAPPEPVAPPSSPVVQAEPAKDAERPSPWEAPKPGRTHKHMASAAKPATQTAVAQPMPAPIAAPPVSSPEPTKDVPPEPAAPANPPARVEAVNVTPPPPPAPPEPAKVTLNAGTLLSVRLVDGLNAERNRVGDTFAGTLDRELVVNGFVIAERGARVDGRVTAADLGGRVKGLSSLSVEITKLHTSDGQTVALRTDPFQRQAEPDHKGDAAKIGGGAALGAIIGAIAGGGKGAAIGAGAGGAAGTGTVMATRGKPAVIPSETRITFRLSAPVTVTERR